MHDRQQHFALGLFAGPGSFVRERALVLVFQLFSAVENTGDRQYDRRDQHQANPDPGALFFIEIIHVLASLVKRGSW